MNPKSKWKGAVLLTMALVLALSLAVPVMLQKPGEAEAGNLTWGLAEGVPALGLPAGAGALLDVAVVPGTNTVFVLSDPTLSTPPVVTLPLPPAGVATVVLYRSDNGGLSWGTPVNIPITAVTEVGVDVEISPAYDRDGTVFVLTNDPVAGTGLVYASDDKGITWGVAGHTTAATPAGSQVNALAVDPNFNSLLSGGTIAVATTWDGVTGASVFYETWQSPVVGWSGVWTPVPSNPADMTDTYDVMYAPTSSVRVIAVQYDFGTASVWGLTGSINTGFPAVAAGLPVPGVTSSGTAVIYFDPLQATTNAVIAVGDDYDPVSTLASPNSPMYFFVATDDGPAVPLLPLLPVGSTYWFDPTLAVFVDLKAASTLPALHMDTSGLVARGMYTRAELLTGCSNTPLTYNVDVRTMVWGTPTYIEGDGGPIGVISNNVGVKMDYVGSGNQVHAITTQVPASAYGIAPATVAGDLTVLSQSDNFGASWWDTCLTQEDFRQVIQDQAWVSTLSGFIVTDTGTGIQSTFKAPVLTQWKRVDRWQGVQVITIASSIDDDTIFLLDTSPTGMKVLRSLDGGDTFTATAADPVAIVTIMMTAIAAGTADDIYVGDWNGHIYVTHDGGATWTDTGQVAGAIKSMAAPRFYSLVPHVIAGVDSLVGFTQNVIVSKDAGATWNTAGIAMWGGGGYSAAGHIEAKFSPMYNGSTENLAYVGLNGTGADDMYRADLSAFAPWTRMALPGNPLPVANFEVVRVAGIVGDPVSSENILYVLNAGTSMIYATYYPELVSGTVPLWRADPAAVLWGALGGAAVFGLAGPTIAGNVNLPCPFDVVVGAGSPGSVTLFTRDSAPVLGVHSIPNITETAAFLTPIASVSPIEGAIVPSNNTATGEPVELQWSAVPGATSYDVMTITDINNPATVLGGGTVFGNPGFTEFSIGVGTVVDGQTYFWRTRVAATTGRAAHTGPWSAYHSFTVEAVEIHVAPTLLSPAGGETGVTTSPMFRWSVIQDVVTTDFELASDAAFLNIIDTQTFAAQQTYVYDGGLDLETTYHWRVRGHGGTGIDAWTTPWSEGIFFTEGPPPPPPPAPTVIVPPDIVIQEGDEITPGWIWALIVIGAVLAVVVIVLIMRTRRPV